MQQKHFVCCWIQWGFFSRDTEGLNVSLGLLFDCFCLFFYLLVHLYFYVCENVHHFQFFCVVVKIKKIFFVFFVFISVYVYILRFWPIKSTLFSFVINNTNNDNTSNKSVVVKIKKNIFKDLRVLFAVRGDTNNESEGEKRWLSIHSVGYTTLRICVCAAWRKWLLHQRFGSPIKPGAVSPQWLSGKAREKRRRSSQSLTQWGPIKTRPTCSNN